MNSRMAAAALSLSPMVAHTLRIGGLAALVAVGCESRGVVGSKVGAGGDAGVADTGGDDDDDDATGGDDDDDDDNSDDDDDDDSATDTGPGVIFDVGNPDGPEVCGAPLAVTCDAQDADPAHAVGLNCIGGFEAEVELGGSNRSFYVHDGALGTQGVFDPREGSKMLVMSSGDASHLPLTPEQLMAKEGCDPIACPSTWHNQEILYVLPPPIDVRRVDDEGESCEDDPSLVGKGDCSNTLQAEFEAGDGAFDYAELRVRATVPPETDAVRYHFAFFSIEYPLFADHGSPYNDMYIAWLQSERWTGNISFDDKGNPITINGVFLDYRDASTASCPGCEAPELEGFAAEGHAGTRWLETVAPVVSGEQIEMVFSIMDISDDVFDSMVILDGFEWTCSDLPPITTPEG